MVRPHLDHRETVLRFDAGQHQRHADVVVQVALGSQGGSGRRETCRGQFLECRLAVAARHADDDWRQLPPPRRAEFAERTPGILDRDLRDRLVDEPRYDGAGSTLATRLSDVIAAVEVRALQRNEEFSLAERAGVGAHAVEGLVGAMKPAVHEVGSSCEGRHHLPPSPRSSRAARLAAATA